MVTACGQKGEPVFPIEYKVLHTDGSSRHHTIVTVISEEYAYRFYLSKLISLEIHLQTLLNRTVITRLQVHIGEILTV
jgi:hypothetical protein